MSTTHHILTDPSIPCTCFQCSIERLQQFVLETRDETRIMLANIRVSVIASRAPRAPYTRKNRAPLDLGGEAFVPVPTSVEELGTSLELAEQAVDEEKTVSPASESCQNMASPNFGGEQAYSVPPSVDQLGKLSIPNIRPYHVPDCATHMAPAKSPADVVPSPVLVMDFRNLQYRRHVKHLVDYTDVACMGSNTINSCGYAYSS